MSNMAHPAFGGTVSAFVPNALFMPGKDPVMMSFKVKEGQTLKAGSVMGFDDNGEAVLSLAAANDGSEVPSAILVEDLDTSAESDAIKFSLCVEGAFNETALVYGTGHTADTVRIALRDRGIYLNAPKYSYA
ncbi:MAG: head decoration protein [Hyphomicrobiaceae bacterium]